MSKTSFKRAVAAKHVFATPIKRKDSDGKEVTLYRITKKGGE